MAAHLWPQPGQRLSVEVLDGPADLVAVVDDVRPPEQLHLRAPVPPDGGRTPEVPVGAAVVLTWTTAAGQHSLRTALTAAPVVPLQLWCLEPTRPPVVLQRRSYVRVVDALRVDLTRGEQRWPACLCDLSEGGVRCVLLAPDDLVAGDALRVSLQLEETNVEVAAVVLEVDRATAERTTVRLQFGELRSNGDIIRRRVLEQQRRARAVAAR